MLGQADGYNYDIGRYLYPLLCKSERIFFSGLVSVDLINAMIDERLLLEKISIKQSSEYLGDIDHFFPHSLKKHKLKINLDGIWNLVLSCKDCNRGPNGKFALIPDKLLLYRLEERNDWLIFSHHPLRETIINQTGTTSEKRKRFLNQIYEEAIKLFPYSKWRPNSA